MFALTLLLVGAVCCLGCLPGASAEDAERCKAAWAIPSSAAPRQSFELATLGRATPLRQRAHPQMPPPISPGRATRPVRAEYSAWNGADTPLR